MKIFVDIDNTICYTDSEDPLNYNKVKPDYDRIKKINELYDDGHEISYWTARGTVSQKDWRKLTQKQLHKWGCKYTFLIMGKPNYDVYIDDKSFNSEDFFRNEIDIFEEEE